MAATVVRYKFQYTFRTSQYIITRLKAVYWLHKQTNKNKLRGLSPRANYTDRAAAAGRRS